MQPTTPPNCHICPHRNTCLFSSLDEASKREWIGLRRARIYSQGEGIFSEVDEPSGVYVACEGKVKIFKSTQTGKNLTTKILPSGSIFGHRSLLAQEAYSASAEAFSDAVISKIDSKSFLKFLQRHWPAATLILRQFAQGIREGEDKAREIAFSSSRARLAQALVTFSKKSQQGPVVTTLRKELAQVAGIVPETCVRLIRRFEQEGVVRRQGRRAVAIVDPKLLANIAGGSLTTSQ